MSSLASRYSNIGDTMKAWGDLFQKAQTDAHSLVRKKKLTTKVAACVSKAPKNRYTNVLPYDQPRIVLRPEDESQTPGYINASPVSVDKAKRRYILTQGPVPESLSDFWQMVHENNVPAIVMLNKLYEGDMLKCEPYFPTSENRDMQFVGYSVSLVTEEAKNDFIVRRLKLRKNCEGIDEGRSIVHIQYTEWPDFGVPVATSNFLAMLDFIKALDVLSVKEDDPPVVVHCSAGIGRSGTFVLVDAVIRMVELGIPQSEIDVNAILANMRTQRMGLIQTPDQLRFSWKAIVDGVAAVDASERDPGAENDDDASDTVCTPRDVNKRKSESQEETDERMSKRREQVALMVARSRLAEEARDATVSPRSLILGAAVAVIGIAGYYYLGRR